MITEIGNYNIGRIPSDFVGLSTDTKPTDVENASTFYEMDTKTVFLYDEENEQWLAQ